MNKLSRRDFLSIVGGSIIAPQLIGCGPPDVINSDSNGIVSVSVGPAQLTINLNNRVITAFNGNFQPIGLEIIDFHDSTRAIWTNYYIGGNSSQSSPPLGVLTSGLTLNVIVATYSGKVSAAWAAALRWTGISQLQGLADDQVVTRDYRVFTIH